MKAGAGDAKVAVLARQVDDPLLDCLEYAAHHFGLAFSRAGAIAGLPLAEGRLVPGLVQRAAARVGMKCRLVQRLPSRVTGLVAPFIVLLNDADACVVAAVNRRRRLTIVFPSVSQNKRTVKAAELDKASSGYLFLVTPDPALRPDAMSEEPMAARRGHWFWAPVRRLWPAWLQVLLAAMVTNLLGLAIPLFTMNVYDRVIPNLAISTLWALTLGVVLALFLDMALRQLRTMVLDSTGRRVDMKISAELFEQALGIDMAARGRAAGAIANQIREFETVRDFFTSQAIIAATDFLFIGVFLAFLWLIVGPLTYVPLFAVPIVLIATLLMQVPLARAIGISQGQASARHALLVESLIGVETIKAASAEGVMQRRWEEAVAATARASSAMRVWSTLAMNFTSLVQQAVGIVVIVWGVFLVAQGRITIGGLIAASILSGRVLQPLGSIAMTVSRAHQAINALREISHLMKLPSDRRRDLKPGNRIPNSSVEFRRVSFSYPNSQTPTLRELTLAIKPGERVGIIGKIGSGKTTIGKLIAGLYAPAEGSVLVGGADNRSVDGAVLRQTVAYVPQEPELFTGSVRDNIVLGRPWANEEEIAQVAKISGVDGFTAAHPLGLGLPVGERGLRLSGGQRQAVALARMLIRKPSVLFLDEPSSALDTATEAGLVQEISAWLGEDVTLIVSTHKGQFLKLVNRLVVIDGGRIVADGPRDEVLAKMKAGLRARRAGEEAAQAQEAQHEAT